MGGLNPEKKKMLKKLIMQKANEVMKAELQQRAKEKEDALKKMVEPLKIDGMSKRIYTPSNLNHRHWRAQCTSHVIGSWTFSTPQNNF